MSYILGAKRVTKNHLGFVFGYFTVYINDVPSSQENLTLSAKHPTSISLMPQSLIGLFPFQKCPSFGDDTFSTIFFFFFYYLPYHDFSSGFVFSTQESECQNVVTTNDSKSSHFLFTKLRL